MGKSHWKESEIEILRQHKDNLSVREIQEKYLPHYSEMSIRGAFIRYKIKKTMPNAWTEEELNLLKKHYVHMGARAMIEAGMLNRSAATIQAKASEFNLKLTPQARAEVNRKSGVIGALQSKQAQEKREKFYKEIKGKKRSDYQEEVREVSPIHRKVNKIIDAHFAGQKFARGTEEYELGKKYVIINY